MSKKYELWVEGFNITGNSGPDHVWKEVFVDNVADAVEYLRKTDEDFDEGLLSKDKRGNYYYWGCKLWIEIKNNVMREKLTKYECQELLMNYFKLTDKDMKNLWRMFMEYGLTKGEAPHRSTGNHYFLQGVCEHMVVEYREWKNKMTKEVLDIIEKDYPQLMVTKRKFRWS